MTMKKIQVFIRSDYEDDCPIFTGDDLKVTYATPTNTVYYGTGITYSSPTQVPALMIYDGSEIIAAFSEYLYWKKIE